MRQGTNGRRPRGRPHRKQQGGGGTPRHGNFDSSGPEGRIRGNAHQVYEKYIGLARDALSFGDRVAAETYFQHAEHYYRIVNARTDPKPNGEGQPEQRSDNGQAEAAGEAARAAEQPAPAPVSGNGEQSRDARQAPQADERPAAQGRRRPRQAKAAPDPRDGPKPEPQPKAKPKEQAKPQADEQAGEDGEPAEA